jgi:hypothetical protein
MSKASEHKHYTVQDIERYHSGKMSAQEMHALEDAALEDTFLSDALEGYTLTPTPSADLSLLQNKLQEHIEKKRRAGLFTLNNQWLRIAALVIIIAGAGWFIYKGTATRETPVALNKENKPLVPVHTTTAPTSKDTSANKNFAPSGKDDAKVVIRKHQTDKPVPKKFYETNNKETASVNQIISNPKEEPSAPATFRTEKANEPGAKKEDEARKANSVSASGIPAVNTVNGTDSFKNFSLAEKDKRSTDSTTHINVALQPMASQKPEVITMQRSDAKRALPKEQTIIDTLEPAKGWTDFDEYIANHLKSPDELNIKPVTGEVLLSFEVNGEGQATNIKVEKSLCEKCDQEAIRLLKEGPKWKKKKNKRGNVIIRF